MSARLFGPFALVASGLLLAAVACGDGSAAESVRSGPASESAVTARAAADQQQGISVSGRGSATAVPDTVILGLGVSTSRDTARQARDDAASAMSALLDSLKSNGVEGDDIKTTQFSISPEIDHPPNGEQVIRGYRVTNIVSAKVGDLERVGEIIDEAVDAVGDPIRVSGITFTIDNTEELLSQARADAMADAKAKAQQLANLADVDLGRPIFIGESSGGGPGPFFPAPISGVAAEAVTPIEPGELEIIVAVQVTYAIGTE
jgi:uncharacterized protein YggE